MKEPIDFVIYWVDGADPEHVSKRLRYQKEFSLLDENNEVQSTNQKRFVQKDELKYCLRSIKQFAPWYRKILLLTDSQIPAFLDTKRLHLDRIEIVEHTTLFHNRSQCLPTFNSRALTTQLAELQQLSQQFILGNDDIMLSAPVEPTYFFEHELPVIYADRVETTRIENKSLYFQGILNALRLIDANSRYVYLPSHGFTALDKARLTALCNRFPAAFQNNFKYRFRHESQMLVECLYMFDCIKEQQCVLKDTELMVHFSFELCQIGKPEKIHFLFDLLESGKRKMFCLNDFEVLVDRMHEITERLEKMCGAPLECETGC